ncbi:MAG: hypothetical protein A1D16_04885 [Flavihumibacter sp. CACIAM 22H1]|nr:MAG: hypothetical protein A1D16_04885 [Flavihumibacter sp. CACIAM 22H1]
MHFGKFIKIQNHMATLQKNIQALTKTGRLSNTKSLQMGNVQVADLQDLGPLSGVGSIATISGGLSCRICSLHP